METKLPHRMADCIDSVKLKNKQQWKQVCKAKWRMLQ